MIPSSTKNKFADWKYIYYGIFLMPLVVNPFGLTQFEIPKQSWMMGWMALFAIVFMMMILPQKRLSFSWNPKIFLIIGLWLASFGLSTLLAVAPLESFFGSYERMQGTLTFLYYFLHLVICLQLFEDKTKIKTFFELIILVGALLSIHAILQRLRLDPLQIGNIDQANGRSYATIGQPNFLGQMLIFPLTAAAIFAKENLRLWNKQWKKLFYYVFQTLLCGIGLFLSFNRGSLLAIIIAALLFLLYEIKIKKSTKLIIGLIGCALVIGGTIFLTLNDRSGDSRLLLWQDSLPLLGRNILFGSGPESFYQTFQTVLTKNLYLTESLYNIPDRVHNETLQIALDQGLFGLTLYVFNLFILGSIYVRAKLKTAASKIAFYSITATIIALQFSFSISVHVIMLLSMWAILLRETHYFKTLTFNIGPIKKIIAAIIIISFSIFSISKAISMIQADNLMQQGIEEYIGSAPDALSKMEKAVATNPYYEYLPYTEIYFLSLPEYLSKNPLAIPKLDEALKKIEQITNGSFHYELAAAKLAEGENMANQAEQHLKSAAQKAPNFPLVWQEWGMFNMNQQNFSEAVTHFEKLTALAPPYWQWVENQQNLTSDQKEKLRIFVKTQGSFYEALSALENAYEQTNQIEKSLQLRKILTDTAKFSTSALKTISWSYN